MKIEVTQQDIDTAIAGDAHHCPIALAIERRFTPDGVCDVDVAGPHATWVLAITDFGFRTFTAEMTNEAQVFQHDFDTQQKVSPFTLELHAIEEVVA